MLVRRLMVMLRTMPGRDLGIREHHVNLLLYISQMIYKTINQESRLVGKQMSVVSNEYQLPSLLSFSGSF